MQQMVWHFFFLQITLSSKWNLTTAVHQVSFSNIATKHLYGIYDTNETEQNVLLQVIKHKLPNVSLNGTGTFSKKLLIQCSASAKQLMIGSNSCLCISSNLEFILTVGGVTPGDVHRGISLFSGEAHHPVWLQIYGKGFTYEQNI